MNLHEFQGKKILAEHGVNIQRGCILSDKKNVLKVGLSFFEPVDKILNVEEHDIKLDCVITPNIVYNFT